MYNVYVLLAAYNGEQWLKEQIDSILNQQNVNITLFISCDISTDRTLDLIESYKSSKIILLPYGKKFGAAAPNFYRLISEVQFVNCDYVALSDQDDIWLPDKISIAIKKINQNRCVGYSSNVTAFWENGKKKEIVKSTPKKKYDYLFEGPGPGCTFVMTKGFALDFQNYMKENSCMLKKLDWHDWLIYAYARSRGRCWYIDNTSHIFYRQHNNNQLGANSGFRQFKKRVDNIVSGYGIQQSVYTIFFLNLQTDDFIKTWLTGGRKKFLILAKSSKDCRRKTKDIFLFWVSCIIMFLKNTKITIEA